MRIVTLPFQILKSQQQFSNPFVDGYSANKQQYASAIRYVQGLAQRLAFGWGESLAAKSPDINPGKGAGAQNE